MVTRSKKNKGRRLAIKVANILSKYVKCEVTSSSIVGEDIRLFDKLLGLDFDIECKNQERLDIGSAIKQVYKRINKNGKEPLLFISKNRFEIRCIMNYTTYTKITNNTDIKTDNSKNNIFKKIIANKNKDFFFNYRDNVFACLTISTLINLIERYNNERKKHISNT